MKSGHTTTRPSSLCVFFGLFPVDLSHLIQYVNIIAVFNRISRNSMFH